MEKLQPGDRAHRNIYKIRRVLVATVGMFIACGCAAFVLYYFHLVDFLTPFVNGIIRVMAGLFFIAVIYMYVKYLSALDYEYNLYYNLPMPQEQPKAPRGKHSEKADKSAEKKAARNALKRKNKAGEPSPDTVAEPVNEVTEQDAQRPALNIEPLPESVAQNEAPAEVETAPEIPAKTETVAEAAERESSARKVAEDTESRGRIFETHTEGMEARFEILAQTEAAETDETSVEIAAKPNSKQPKRKGLGRLFERNNKRKKTEQQTPVQDESDFSGFDDDLFEQLKK